MENKVSIISNSRPLYMIEPVTDDDKIVDLYSTPVIAWRVEYNEEHDSAFASPITVDTGLPDVYALHDSETNEWTIPDNTAGEGLDSLLKYFKEQESRDGQLDL